jgi:hypothetical protein
MAVAGVIIIHRVLWIMCGSDVSVMTWNTGEKIQEKNKPKPSKTLFRRKTSQNTHKCGIGTFEKRKTLEG